MRPGRSRLYVRMSVCPYVQGTEELHPQMVRQARKSGQLNLSNRGLVSVPDRVWTLMELDQEETKAASQRSMTDNNAENWWDMVDMTKLILACNKISTISDKVLILTVGTE